MSNIKNENNTNDNNKRHHLILCLQRLDRTYGFQRIDKRINSRSNFVIDITYGNSLRFLITIDILRSLILTINEWLHEVIFFKKPRLGSYRLQMIV